MPRCPSVSAITATGEESDCAIERNPGGSSTTWSPCDIHTGIEATDLETGASFPIRAAQTVLAAGPGGEGGLGSAPRTWLLSCNLILRRPLVTDAAVAPTLLQQMLDLITEELAQGNEVTLRRFGTFEVRVAKSKVGRNPNKPGSDMRIPPRAVVRFKPGNELKVQVAAVLPRLLDGNGPVNGAERPEA